jgi:hypothetical protein
MKTNSPPDWTEVPVPLNELFKHDYPDPIPPRNHKHISIDYDTMEIVIDKKYEYRIDLDHCANSGHMLDWIFQIHGKEWCDGELIKELLDTFEELSRRFFNTNAQGPFCPGGCPRRWNWKTGTSTPIKR